MQTLMFEGIGEELHTHLNQYPHDRFLLILLPVHNDHSQEKHGIGLKRGMFPQLQGLQEEDFKVAEWHGEDESL